MNWLVYHIASGQAFFSGVALMILAAYASTRTSRIGKRLTGRQGRQPIRATARTEMVCSRWSRVFVKNFTIFEVSSTVLCFLVGAIAIAISSTAIPYWYYAIAVVVTIVWMASRYVERLRRWAPLVVIGVWTIAAAVELPYHIRRSLAPAPSRSIAVIGDSVTAGMGPSDKSVRWPALLAERHDLDVHDISYPGETAASALKRAKTQQIGSPVVILEIGGNDLLGSTPPAQFSRDLDALLGYVRAPGRQLVMFELPLPPFSHEYGRIQRWLARKHNVTLVPKRVLLSVLTADDSTVDTIHLSQVGHQRMAACVWEIVSSAFPVIAEPAVQRERQIASEPRG